MNGQNLESTGATDTEAKKCGLLKNKKRRSSFSRRVSFSTTAKIKEFHDGQHEVILVKFSWEIIIFR